MQLGGAADMAPGISQCVSLVGPGISNLRDIQSTPCILPVNERRPLHWPWLWTEGPQLQPVCEPFQGGKVWKIESS